MSKQIEQDKEAVERREAESEQSELPAEELDAVAGGAYKVRGNPGT